ncbi:hypothetical protein GH714_004601 [Hevea brasiliensis]|uniref:Uncharacterized protein n=1 Tax=Hevea brasiliensis TaxID=3981 RepID=A0A6A6M7I4_HEVBR|nr:hypothetical protein GH714_004601 [Hevea brasiliensis]
MSDMQILPGARHRPPLKRPIWIIVLVSMVSLFLVCAYVYPPQSSAACYVFSSRGCKALTDWLPPAPERQYTDGEIASQGHEGRFSVYVHASKENLFMWCGEKFQWLMQRLLANALEDPDNQHFVLLSDSCVPLYNFDYVYNYLMYTNISFVDCFYDPGPHGNGRYSEHMLPEIEKKDFRKGAQWFSLKRQHAVIVMADSLYYSKFLEYCKPGLEGKNCIADEHYLPTFFHLVDPGGIANWSVTHVDWSERKWHPKSYRAKDITYELLKNITSIDLSIHVTSDEKREVQVQPCLWNGIQRPCYLFARKFYPEAIDNLLQLFSNYKTM